MFNIKGDIRSGDVFEPDVICSLRHPGLCRTRDSKVLPKVEAAAKNLQLCFKNVGEGVAFGLTVTALEGHQVVEREGYAVISYFREAHPRVGVLALCTADETGRRLCVAEDSPGNIVYSLDVSLLGAFFIGSTVQRVSVRRLPWDVDHCCCEDGAFSVLAPVDVATVWP